MANVKQTGTSSVKANAAAKAKANGLAKNRSVSSPAIKSPTRTQTPAELSEADREAVKLWLDNPATEFRVTTAPMSKKRKRSGAMTPQTDIFEDRLDVQYEVKPRDKWECLRRYKKFTVGAESITTGQCILVNHDESEAQGIDQTKQWKAKVLEVRALDSEHVYIRVAWLNRPEDLATGRKAYHGKYELIPTNQMDIIDAMTVNGPCDVMQWDDQDDESPNMPEDQFFWRQTFDHVGTKTFSDLRKICTDKAPINPDEAIIQCPNVECRMWLHVKCVAEMAAREVAGPTSNKAPAKKKAKRDSTVTIRSDSLALAKAVKDDWTVEVFIADPTNSDGGGSEKSYLEITGPEGAKTTKDVQCLQCNTKIE